MNAPPDPLVFDSNATSAYREAALAQALRGQRLLALGAAHHPRTIAWLIARARARIARALGSHPDEVHLTAGGTAANARVLEAATLRDVAQPARLCLSVLEHPSVLEGARALERAGRATLQLWPISADGQAQLPALGSGEGHPAALASLMMAHNETGVLQPVERLVSHYRGTPTWTHTDAVQAVGRVPVHFHRLGVDFLTVAGHKVGAGAHAGVLLVRRNIAWRAPWWATEQVLPSASALPAWLALACALEQATADLEATHGVRRCRDAFERALAAQCAPIDIVGSQSLRLPNTSCVRVVGCRAETLMVALDVAGICISQGSACSSGVSTPSQAVMTAHPEGVRAAREVVRVSWPMTATEAEAHALVAAMAPIIARMRRPVR